MRKNFFEVKNVGRNTKPNQLSKESKLIETEEKVKSQQQQQ